MVVVQMPPRGRYLAHEAGRLAGVSGNKIGQWARRGYIRSSLSTAGRLPRVYSYQDVAEAIVVHELVERGVLHRDIRHSVDLLRQTGGDWPLTGAREAIATADVGERSGEQRAMLVIGVGSELYDLRRAPSQQVLEPANLRRIAADLSRGGWAVRDVPDLRLIEINPDIIGGRPAIRGHRVPADLVAELAGTAGGREILAEGYDIGEDEIRDAERWWAAVSRYELAA